VLSVRSGVRLPLAIFLFQFGRDIRRKGCEIAHLYFHRFHFAALSHRFYAPLATTAQALNGNPQGRGLPWRCPAQPSGDRGRALRPHGPAAESRPTAARMPRQACAQGDRARSGAVPARGKRLYGASLTVLELEVRRLDCRHCGKVKRERLDFLADNPLYTKRFAYYVGRRCRSATIKDVAAELKLDWHTVKALDQQYMEAQLKRAGTPGPRVIGIDEIAI
jgi:hypothetical protein